MKKFKVLATVLLLVAIMGCSGCESIATLKKALLVDKTAWGGMQNDFIAWHDAGQINETTWAQINVWDKRLVSIHNLATDLGKTYELTKDKQIYEQILAIVGESAQIIADGRKVWNSFKGGK